jgi:hypothetical protein
MKRLRILSVLTACVLTIFTSSANAVTVSGQGTWETTLLPRDLDGNLSTAEAYYDTDLNITWLDANNGGNGDWFTAYDWAAGQNINGITGWRLPVTNPVDGITTNDQAFSYIGTQDRGLNISAPGTLYAGSTASEMAHLFYNTLGNLGDCDPITSTESTCDPQLGSGLTNTGPFRSLEPTVYWSNTLFASYPAVWSFNFGNGQQDNLYAGVYGALAWSVHPGDVGTPIVPLPNPVRTMPWLNLLLDH